MKKDKKEKVICFDKSGFVNGNLIPQKNYFLGYSYGEGMFLQKPSDAMAFALISAHKKMSVEQKNENESKLNPLSSLMHNINLLIDFHESYSIKDFKQAVNKTYSEDFEEVNEFLPRLEKNIVVKGNPNHINNLIKKRLMSQIKSLVKMDNHTDKSSIAFKLLAVKSVPEGYLKMDLFTEALETIFVNQSWSESLFSENNIFSKKIDKKELNSEIDAQYKASKDLLKLINESAKVTNEELLNCKIYKEDSEYFIQ